MVDDRRPLTEERIARLGLRDMRLSVSRESGAHSMRMSAEVADYALQQLGPEAVIHALERMAVTLADRLHLDVASKVMDVLDDGDWVRMVIEDELRKITREALERFLAQEGDHA